MDWTIDFSAIDPPADFVALRDVRNQLRVPPLLGAACRPLPFGDQPRHGEDFSTRLLAEVELLRLLESAEGRAAIDRVVFFGKTIQEAEKDVDCVDGLAPGYRVAGISSDLVGGWLRVKSELKDLPELFGVPGTNDTATPLGQGCERKIEEGKGAGDNWDMTMALVVRIWLRGRDGVHQALQRWYRSQIDDAILANQRAEADFVDLERRVARVAWLQGSPSAFDTIACGQVPETENHTLMIETTRFLHNESLPVLPRSDLGTSDQDPERWLHLYDVNEDADNERNGTGKMVRGWLKRFVNHDFLEYNARSSARHQMLTLLNLYDLAQGDDIRRRAESVIDLLAAKFAAESMNGLRTIPYRRRSISDNNLMFNGDPLNPMFQVWTGALAPTSIVPSDSATQMVVAASSDYRLPDLLVDVIHNPAHHHYFQEFDAAGQRERTFGARDFTLSGGGEQTDCPYPFTGGGLIGAACGR